MKPKSQYTAREGQELSKRLENARAKGGVPDAVVHREMLEDMERDLRQLAAQYDGSEARAKDLLEALVVARESGVPACDEIEHLLAQRVRQSA